MSTNTKSKKSKYSGKRKKSNTPQFAKNVKRSNEIYMAYAEPSIEAWDYANDMEGINFEKLIK